MAWFKKTRKPMETPDKASRVPEGLWVKCPSCNRVIYNKELVAGLGVCPHCDHHFRMSAVDRLKMLFDNGQWVEDDAGLRSLDPLKFTDTKAYRDRLASTIKNTGLNDAIIVGRGTIDGIPAIVCAMEYTFIGGSMGVVVGEKITRAAERALAEHAPLIVVCCSGGARMMEGALSLMQMAKISAALGRLDHAGLPYLSILSDPTTGGVTASFAMIGDLNIAEPKALIGFAGPYRFLFPAIVVFCSIGSYTLNNSPFDVYMTAGFTLVGYTFWKLGCEPAPLLLGFILGPMMEENLRRALLLSRGDWMTFATRPLSATLLVMALAMVVVVMLPSIKAKRQEAFQDED